MEARKFEFNGKEVTFETERGYVMVNATEMGKIFSKKVSHFVENQNTQDFIKACLNSRNSDYLNVKVEEDLITSKQKTGTYMHRILALKFAAWLNPDFEVWVYATIDELMFGSYKEDDESLKEIAKIQIEIAEKEKVLENSPIQKEIEDLKKKQKSEENKIKLRKKMKLNSYVSMFTPEEMSGDKSETI